MTTYKAKVCRGCGNDFRPEVRGQAYCTNCHAIRANEAAALLAARPWRECKECGEQKQSCDQHNRCSDCRVARRDEIKARRHQLREEFLQEQSQRKAGQDLRRHARRVLTDTVLKLPPEERLNMVAGLLRWVLDRVEQVQENDPEEVPADDQERIDATFASIMEGFDL